MKKILLFLSLISFFSCKKYETQYGTKSSDTTNDRSTDWDMVYTTNKGVFILNANMSRTKQIAYLTALPTDQISSVSLSENREKIAYIQPNGIPMIIDTAGNVLQELTQYTNVDDLGWYSDSSLFLLSNNQIYVWGTNINLPTFKLPTNSNIHGLKVTALDVNKNLDILYGFSYYEYNNTGDSLRWVLQKQIHYKNKPTLFIKKELAAYSGDTSNPSTADQQIYYLLHFSDTSSYDRDINLYFSDYHSVYTQTATGLTEGIFQQKGGTSSYKELLLTSLVLPVNSYYMEVNIFYKKNIFYKAIMTNRYPFYYKKYELDTKSNTKSIYFDLPY